MYRVYSKHLLTDKKTIKGTWECRTLKILAEAINDILYFHKATITGIDKAQYVGPALPDGGGKAYTYVPIEEWKNNE